MVSKNVSKKQTRKIRKKGGDDNNEFDVSNYRKNGGYVYITYTIPNFKKDNRKEKLQELFQDNNILDLSGNFKIRYEIDEDRLSGNIIYLEYAKLVDNTQTVVTPDEDFKGERLYINYTSQWLASTTGDGYSIPKKDTMDESQLKNGTHTINSGTGRVGLSRYEPFPPEEREERDNRKKEKAEKEARIKAEEEEARKKAEAEKAEAEKAEAEKAAAAPAAAPAAAAEKDNSFFSRLFGRPKSGGKRKHKSKRKSLKKKRKQTKKRKGRR